MRDCSSYSKRLCSKRWNDTNTDQKVKDQAKKAQVTTPTKPATKPPSSEDKVRSFLMICDALERGEALEEDMKKSLIEVLALKRSPEQQIRLITVARSLKLDPEIFTQSNKSPEEILSDLNFEIGTLPLGLTLKDLIRSVKNILQPATETKGKKPDVAAPRITLESFIKLCDDMEAGKELKGVKSSLANALMLPRSSQQEADFQDLLDQLNLKSADFAHLNFQPLYETVKDFSAKQLSDLCFGLKTLLTKTNEKKAEQTKEKEKEKEKEALLAHLNEICNKIEKGHLTKGMNLTSTLVKLLAQKRNPAETENFQNLLSNLILDPKLLNTTRAALKIWKKNPERSTQTQIRADLTGIAYNDQKRLCLEVRKLYRQTTYSNKSKYRIKCRGLFR
jgi:hypothetical protein